MIQFLILHYDKKVLRNNNKRRTFILLKYVIKQRKWWEQIKYNLKTIKSIQIKKNQLKKRTYTIIKNGIKRCLLLFFMFYVYIA